ncbi:type I secretion system permease/ATPase [Brucella gallinifaecis]|uniref:Type I secretion system permease/ATPase n=1 Tax=Brucella gallinifaecis TaxID=215590 RepID=A0A502BGB3_9HYPH|nr:type I secretion system permease/ATPase [Brucella gallinifaecis]TPF73922.1 type I secretion system permease/ATPase [Brucella gallinifaecis]
MKSIFRLSMRSSSIISIIIFSAIINLLSVTSIIYMIQVYDRVLSSQSFLTLLFLSVVVVFIYSIISFLEFCRNIIITRAAINIDRKLSSLAFQITDSSIDTNTSKVFSCISEIRNFIDRNGLAALIDAPWFVFYICILFILNVWLGVYALCSTIILIVAAVINDKLLRLPTEETTRLSLASAELIHEKIAHAEVVRSLGMFPNFNRRWAELHEGFLNSLQISSERGAGVTACIKFIRMCLQSLILGLGAWLAIQGEISAGMIIAGTFLLGRTLAPIEQLIQIWRSWVKSKSAYSTIIKALSVHKEHSDHMCLPRPKGFLTLENISVQRSGRTILYDLNFCLQPGDITGVIGPSASGKTTLVRLIVGACSTATGTVRLDNADIQQWNPDDLGKYIGYLPQSVELFAGTVAQNIARFNAIDTDEIIRATQLAGVHEMILRLPQGYDTILGQGGIGLSGGQKQRIGLARALYGDPSLIVLDEPNSNLDIAGNEALHSALEILKQQKKTVLLVTHSKSLLDKTDKTLLLIEGKIEAFGSIQTALQRIEEVGQNSSNSAVPSK